MPDFALLPKNELEQKLASLKEKYEKFKQMNLALDMSRGKPSPDQLDLTNELLTCLNPDECPAEHNNGFDLRNYGMIEGLKSLREIFAQMMEIPADQIILGGSSSLNLMFDTISWAMLFGVIGSETPWSKLDEVKFLCPAPGYDRHFSICEKMSITMINIPMTPTGPDMDLVEKLVKDDPSVKGIWCVPKYSNPQGITYSDETVRRLAKMQTASPDFRIFWDNAYCVHHLSDQRDTLLNIYDECKNFGNPNRVLIFASTSKISFSGAGVPAMGASPENIANLKSIMAVQTICNDKINQYRHAKFFRNLEGIEAHMQKHAEIVKPKFDIVCEKLDELVVENNSATYIKPNGGYFISVETSPGCAAKVVKMCKDAGVILTPAGASFPYGKDPQDSNIRIAPTYPSCDELSKAMDIFCTCANIAYAEKCLSK